MKQVIFTTAFLALCFSAKVTDAQMRLQAEAHYQNAPINFVLQDSTMYMNSGATKSTVGKFNIPEFDLMYDSAVVYDGTGAVDKTIGQTFDGSNHITERITYEADGTNDAKVEVTYKSNKPDTVFYQTWSSQFSTWRDAAKTAYGWSGNNKIFEVYQTRSFGGGGGGPTWRNRYKNDYSYNGSGQVTNLITARWNSGAWVDSARYALTYSNGDTGSMTVDVWDATNSVWVQQDRYTFTFTNNKKTSKEKEFYSSGTWYKAENDIYIYTSGGVHHDTLIHQLWDGVGGIYANATRYGYRFNTDGQVTYVQKEQWDGTQWTEQQNQEFRDFYYYGWPNSVNEVATKADNGINVFPSPANNTLNINVAGESTDAHFAIVDVTGKTVQSFNANTGGTINVSVSELPAGTYLLNVDNGTSVKTERFVISR